MTEESNPYAPPVGELYSVEMEENWVAGRVWRLGDLMVIGNGAELRPRCFVTGEETDASLEINVIWHPGWVYILLFFGIFPYFIVVPFVRRNLRIKVPLSAKLLKAYRAEVKSVTRIGLIALVVSVLGASFFVSSPYMALQPITYMAIAFAVVCWFVRIPPVRLNIVRADNQVVLLSKLPPKCLEGLPQCPWASDSTAGKAGAGIKTARF